MITEPQISATRFSLPEHEVTHPDHASFLRRQTEAVPRAARVEQRRLEDHGTIEFTFHECDPLPILFSTSDHLDLEPLEFFRITAHLIEGRHPRHAGTPMTIEPRSALRLAVV